MECIPISDVYNKNVTFKCLNFLTIYYVVIWVTTILACSEVVVVWITVIIIVVTVVVVVVIVTRAELYDHYYGNDNGNEYQHTHADTQDRQHFGFLCMVRNEGLVHVEINTMIRLKYMKR